jgi:hypothetical protein
LARSGLVSLGSGARHTNVAGGLSSSPVGDVSQRQRQHGPDARGAAKGTSIDENATDMRHNAAVTGRCLADGFRTLASRVGQPGSLSIRRQIVNLDSHPDDAFCVHLRASVNAGRATSPFTPVSSTTYLGGPSGVWVKSKQSDMLSAEPSR